MNPHKPGDLVEPKIERINYPRTYGLVISVRDDGWLCVLIRGMIEESFWHWYDAFPGNMFCRLDYHRRLSTKPA